jgi:hypothetical protein
MELCPSCLELLVDALEAVDLAVESLDVLSAELQLHFEILHFSHMRIAFGSVLRFEFLLETETE